MGKIIVLVKDILDFEEIKSWSSNIKENYKGKKTKVNDLDKNALQAALDIKDEHDMEVVTLSAGDGQTKTALLEVLAMGADGAYLVNDASMRSADQYTLSTVLQAAIEKIGDYDLIICGELALDTMASQMGPRLAALLDIPLIPYVKELKLDGNEVEALKEYENFDVQVRCPKPSIASVIREVN
ncbi:MAG: electron transfer flavoprotein subunit beta, partial [Deltaproteobacteria bacterium]|nr:electron transfer flavoprotein subunit beta [Deltaproteobacteria bacterium]